MTRVHDAAATGAELAGVRRSHAARQAELGELLGLQLTSYGKVGDYHNQHFRGLSARGTTVFVTLLDDGDYWSRALRATPLADWAGIRTPRLLEHGHLHHDHWWLVHEWHDLRDFVPNARNIEKAGELLGLLHSTTTGMHLEPHFKRHDLDEEIETRASALEALDPVAADRTRAARSRWGVIEEPDTVCLTHGDTHWRNFGTDRDGELLWYDWENATCGHPVLDFGKLIDHGLTVPAERDAFLRGYHRSAATIYPWPPAMRLVRLWCTAGVLVYSLARGLKDFAAHGYRVLAQLEGVA